MERDRMKNKNKRIDERIKSVRENQGWIYIYPPKLLRALTLTNKTKIKSELVRFNFV